jgi:hypothetical protein
LEDCVRKSERSYVNGRPQPDLASVRTAVTFRLFHHSELARFLSESKSPGACGNRALNLVRLRFFKLPTCFFPVPLRASGPLRGSAAFHNNQHRDVLRKGSSSAPDSNSGCKPSRCRYRHGLRQLASKWAFPEVGCRRHLRLSLWRAGDARIAGRTSRPDD